MPVLMNSHTQFLTDLPTKIIDCINFSILALIFLFLFFNYSVLYICEVSTMEKANSAGILILRIKSIKLTIL